jgi:hypothetical protein
LAVSVRLVTAAHNLRGEIGRRLDRAADYERAELGSVPFHEVEHAWDAFVTAIGEEGICREVCDERLDWIWYHPASARVCLAGSLEHVREAHHYARTAVPAAGCVQGQMH